DKSVVQSVLQIIDRDAFYRADTQIIFDILVARHRDNRPSDAVILREELIRKNLLTEVGGAAFIGEIISQVPSSLHAAHYANIVREKFLLRQFIDFSNKALRAAY